MSVLNTLGGIWVIAYRQVFERSLEMFPGVG